MSSVDFSQIQLTPEELGVFDSLSEIQPVRVPLRICKVLLRHRLVYGSNGWWGVGPNDLVPCRLSPFGVRFRAFLSAEREARLKKEAAAETARKEQEAKEQAAEASRVKEREEAQRNQRAKKVKDNIFDVIKIFIGGAVTFLISRLDEIACFIRGLFH